MKHLCVIRHFMWTCFGAFSQSVRGSLDHWSFFTDKDLRQTGIYVYIYYTHTLANITITKSMHGIFINLH